MAAATPIAGAPRMTMSLMAAATSPTSAGDIDFFAGQPALVDHDHAAFVPLDRADLAGMVGGAHGLRGC